jgi:hypothetical protein
MGTQFSYNDSRLHGGKFAKMRQQQSLEFVASFLTGESGS